MPAELFVRLYFDDPATPPVELAVRLPRRFKPSAPDPIDWPKDGASAVFCTDAITAKSILEDRQHWAKVMTKAIMDALGRRDTENGYPRASKGERNDAG